MQILTPPQQELLTAYRLNQNLPTHQLMALPDDPLFRIELNTPRIRTWRKLAHSWQQYASEFKPELGTFRYMGNQPGNQRQEIVPGYIGEINFPPELNTLPESVHIVSRPLSPPPPAITSQLYNDDEYVPTFPEDPVRWYYNVGHRLHHCQRCGIDHPANPPSSPSPPPPM